MQVKKFNITLPKKYVSNNEEKTFWANVGTMTEFHKDDGTVGRIIELNHMLEKFSVFEIEQNQNQQPQRQQAPQAQGQVAGGIQYPTDNVNPEDIPF